MIDRDINIYKRYIISISHSLSPRGVVAYVLDCDSIVSEFKLPSQYDVHVRINTLEVGRKSLTPLQILCWIKPRLSFFKGGFGIK